MIKLISTTEQAVRDEQMHFCPYCGKQNIQDEVSVFIEDGPWDGTAYVNEGDYSRYSCQECGAYFSAAPKPIICSKCDNFVTGELGAECDEDPEHEDAYLCCEHMHVTSEEQSK